MMARSSASSGAASSISGQHAQPRNQVRHRDVPCGRCAARRHQHEGSLLPRMIDEMEQRALVKAALRKILDHQRAGGESRWQVRDVDRTRGDRARARLRRPDRRQVALAGALRPRQQHHAVRPVRPTLDQGERRFIRRTDQKILTREALRVIERKRQLAGARRAGCLGGRPSPAWLNAARRRCRADLRDTAAAQSGSERRSPQRVGTATRRPTKPNR